MHEYIYADNNQYEVPEVDSIMGNMWKGKADIIHDDFIIDLNLWPSSFYIVFSRNLLSYEKKKNDPLAPALSPAVNTAL